MLMDWTSSVKSSSVISSMMASMESVWFTTAVQIIFWTPKATSTSLRPSDHLRPSLTTVFLIFAYSAFKS